MRVAFELDLIEPAGTTLKMGRLHGDDYAKFFEQNDTVDYLQYYLDRRCAPNVRADELMSPDSMEIQAAILELIKHDDGFKPEGDGIDEPVVYTLKHPFAYGSDDTISQISFAARRVKDISEFLNADGERERILSFFRCFGTLLGTEKPFTDIVLSLMDAEDVATVHRVIIPLLAGKRGKLRKVS